VATSQGYFPKWQLPKSIFPSVPRLFSQVATSQVFSSQSDRCYSRSALSLDYPIAAALCPQRSAPRLSYSRSVLPLDYPIAAALGPPIAAP